jgi:hypothetical protein
VLAEDLRESGRENDTGRGQADAVELTERLGGIGVRFRAELLGAGALRAL